MSYDLTVYCPGDPTIDQVLLLVGNTRGLHADPENSNDQGVLVLRGVKRGYSFTVDGPFSVEVEDVPEEVTAVLPEATTMFQVLVEGSQEAEIPHGMRFARILAKACHGVALDEQTAEVWPQPRTVKAPARTEPKPERRDVWISWLILEEDLPTDFLQGYLRIAREVLPEAVPVRFGKYEPLQFRFDSSGEEGFIDEFYNDDSNGWDIYYENPLPVTYGKFEAPQLSAGNPFTRITLVVDGHALADSALRSALRRFFLAVATELGALYASAEVRRYQDTRRLPIFNMRPPTVGGFSALPALVGMGRPPARTRHWSFSWSRCRRAQRGAVPRFQRRATGPRRPHGRSRSRKLTVDPGRILRNLLRRVHANDASRYCEGYSRSPAQPRTSRPSARHL